MPISLLVFTLFFGAPLVVIISCLARRIILSCFPRTAGIALQPAQRRKRVQAASTPAVVVGSSLFLQAGRSKQSASYLSFKESPSEPTEMVWARHKMEDLPVILPRRRPCPWHLLVASDAASPGWVATRVGPRGARLAAALPTRAAPLNNEIPHATPNPLFISIFIIYLSSPPPFAPPFFSPLHAAPLFSPLFPLPPPLSLPGPLKRGDAQRPRCESAPLAASQQASPSDEADGGGARATRGEPKGPGALDSSALITSGLSH